MTDALKERLENLRSRLGGAARRSGRDPSSVTLLPVTKTLPAETILAAYGLGLRDFGENRVQEAFAKMQALPPDIRWHLLGRLQSNKINKALGRFVLIHSFDSSRLATAWVARASSGVQDVLLEVNTSGEASKSGVEPAAAVQVGTELLSLPGIRLRGLMTVGPLTEDPDRSRAAFRLLKGLFDALRSDGKTPSHFDTLSMGMSGDFEAAVEEGSTLVRIGTALFGPRENPKTL